MRHAILPVLFALITLPACAQKLKTDEVPQAVRSGFAKAYPNVTGKWEKEKNNYEVNFKKSNSELSCVLDASGNILETKTEINISELPQKVRDYVKQQHPNGKIKEAAKIVKADGEVTYEAEVKGIDLIFNANGDFVKTDSEVEEGD